MPTRTRWIAACSFAVALASPAAAQTNRIVDDDAQGSAANCDDTNPAFGTVGAAIAAAVGGDSVLVCPGTYFENINFGGKAITVQSVSGPAATILDGNLVDSVVAFASGESAASRLEGFTVQNGRASFNGGGIAISNGSPVIRGNLIINNRACSSPGIFVSFGSPVIEDNTIAYNFQYGCSGGTFGGGISIGGASTAVIRRNNIHHNGGVAFGGGISLNSAGTPTIEHNVILANSADTWGGGISLINTSDATIRGNVIARNQAASGGGIYWLVPFGNRGPLLVNNTIAGNHSPAGSGIFADGYDAGAALFNNTIVAAAGQTAVYCGDFNDLYLPVFRSNNVFSATGRSYGGICDAVTGVNGNISTDPQFVDAATDDYRLMLTSPNIDAGFNAAPELPATDLDADPRIFDGNGDGVSVVDIGADETAAGPTPGPPGAFSKSGPADGSIDQPTTIVLSWSPSAGAKAYQYCYDTVNNETCDGSWTLAWTNTAVTITGLSAGTTYYWQVRAIAFGRTVTADGGAFRSFSTRTPVNTRIIALVGDLAFGTLPVGQPEIRTLTIANIGNSLLTVFRVDFPAGFTGFWSGTIPAGASQDVPVTFFPTAAVHSGTVTVWANQTSGTATRVASGTGVPARVIAVSGNLAFGSVRIGTSATRTLTISNSGTAPLTITEIRYPDGFSGAWSGVIAAGASQQVVVTFAPSAPGAHGDVLVVRGDFQAGTNALALSGTGVSGPVITTHPSDQLVEPGSLVTLVAGATGASAVRWQVSLPGSAAWTDIPGSTSTTHSFVAVLSDSGKRFRAVFSDGLSTTISNPAALRVFGPSLIWQHQDGWVALWRMAGKELVQGLFMNPPRVSDTNWKIVGTGDFNGDGRQDLLWHHIVEGWIGVWLMDGVQMISSHLLSPDRVTDSLWRVVGTGDFNGDGRSDILWQHLNDGWLGVWLMNGTSRVEGKLLTPGQVDRSWQMIATGDFNRDGKTDIVWRHGPSGHLIAWLMNGSTLVEAVALNPSFVDPGWELRAVADMNGDGQVDLIWQNGDTIGVWMMNGTQRTTGTLFTPSTVDPSWRIVGPR